MDWETYQNAYKKAPPEMRELLDSERIPVCVKNSLEQRGLPTLRKAFTVQISAHVIGIQTVDETIKNLSQLGLTDAPQLVAEIQTCINQVVNFQADGKESVAQNLSSEISETERELTSLQTVRTMSHDMAAIKPGSDVVYQASSQADILQKEDLILHAEAVSAAPLSPQWDSETK